MKRGFTVVGLGEALFDLFPDRAVLGGAPLNVAVHAHQLAVVHGGRGVPASRIGDDDLGKRIVSELEGRGISAEFLQVDPQSPTGIVKVELKGREPTFDVVRGVAWDELDFTPEFAHLAAECDAVCFGTLGQRSRCAADSIRKFVQAAAGALRMLDVNLRGDAFDAEVLQVSCNLANIVKLNESELPRVLRLLGLEEGGDADASAQRLRAGFGLAAVALTRGANGTVLYTEAGRTSGAPVRYEMHPQADSVGAGDACSAGLLVGLLLGLPAAEVVRLADHMGAFVASQPGATPVVPPEVLALAAAPERV